eukprot:TRINITY_DN7533_c1_g1_i12.p1 TRINITY_DN7533_c1_g1~~TRINITY_DN7533_c1_g1_i12.p1  ORF type:complete len:317 (-),score=33.84 TRINITY_DN7533_c1_g1_i12:501-1451(-)
MLSVSSVTWLECLAARAHVRHKHKSSDEYSDEQVILNLQNSQPLTSFMVEEKSEQRGSKTTCTAKCLLRSGIILLLLLGVWMMWLNLLVRSMPKSAEQSSWKLPKNFDDLHELKGAVDDYSLKHWPLLIVLFVSLYLFLQVFIIPGSVFLNLLAGSLLPVIAALPLVTLLMTAGCTLSFLLSRILLRNTLSCVIPQKIATFRQNIQNQQDQLLYFLLLLRMIPAFPGWFVNLGSSVADVPLSTFVVSTAIGMQPQLLLLVEAGRTLGRLTCWSDLYNIRTVLILVGCSVLALVPILFKKYFPKFQRKELPQIIGKV